MLACKYFIIIKGTTREYNPMEDLGDDYLLPNQLARQDNHHVIPQGYIHNELMQRTQG